MANKQQQHTWQLSSLRRLAWTATQQRKKRAQRHQPQHCCRNPKQHLPVFFVTIASSSLIRTNLYLLHLIHYLRAGVRRLDSPSSGLRHKKKNMGVNVPVRPPSRNPIAPLIRNCCVL